MKLLIKLLIASSLVVVMAAMSTGTALARTVIASGITREGETVEANSEGKITFTDSSGLSLECNVTLKGTIRRQAEGQLRVLEPVTNALVGRITEGRVNECSDREAVVTLLFGAGLWQKYKLEKNAGELSTFYVLHAQILIRRRVPIIGTYECLIDSLATLEYNETTGILRIVSTRTLIRRALGTGFCTERETFRGRFKIRPVVTLTLRDV